jgi:hypothetical protein
MLAFYGAFWGDKKERNYSGIMVIILLALSFGSQTPIYDFMYRIVPLYDRFRGTSKFIFPASLFIIMLAAVGSDKLIKSAKGVLTLVNITNSITLVLFLYAIWVYHYEPMAWNFVKEIIYCACVFMVLSILLYFRPKYNYLSYAIFALGTIEILIFSANWRDSYNVNFRQIDALKKFVADHPGDYRVATLPNEKNNAISGIEGVFGSSANRILRYNEFLSFLEYSKVDPAAVISTYNGVYSELYKILNCRYIVKSGNDEVSIVKYIPDSLPRVKLFKNYKVMQGRDNILHYMSGSGFKLLDEVVLEEPPVPAPENNNNDGVANIISRSMESIVVEADLATPSILVVSNPFIKEWQAREVENQHQKYIIIPADYVIEAMALPKGHHKILIEYHLIGYIIGKWVSVVSVIIFTLIAALRLRKANGNK